jgi:hypothetical protein
MSSGSTCTAMYGVWSLVVCGFITPVWGVGGGNPE